MFNTFITKNKINAKKSRKKNFKKVYRLNKKAFNKTYSFSTKKKKFQSYTLLFLIYYL